MNRIGNACHRQRMNAGLLVSALAATPVLAQSQGDAAADLDTVVVTGIRGSLQSSLNLKRDSSGVVDGIIAEDIGKFPDTNLAESLQRISGVSIDRTDNGEGQRVTVRGVGPDFNLMLLNGRQMPAANIPSNAAGISGSRAFDFSNLASEAVSEMQVYKSARADIASGGIGATINVRTARPLDNPGLRANIGIKGVIDRSTRQMPSSYPGDSITPEVSGIFSNTFADGRLGIAASASYQARDSGYNQVRVNNWSIFQGDDRTRRDRLPLPDEPDYANYDITNRPGPDDVYGRPDSIGYLVNAEQRQRRNGQVVIQFSPLETLAASMDYTYADNRMQRRRDEFLTRFNSTAGVSVWSDGPVAAPLRYGEYVPSGAGDATVNSARHHVRSELKSLGFNLEWTANDNLELALDYHQSKAEVGADSPLGSSHVLSSTTRTGGDVSVDFSRDFPILSMSGGMPMAAENAVLGLSLFRDTFNRSEIEQFQFKGTFRFADYQALDFGLANTEVSNHAADSDNSVFSRLGTPDDYDDALWTLDHIGRYFRRFSGHADPDFSDRFLITDFHRLRARGMELGGEARFIPRTDHTNALRTTEKSRSVYLQWRNTFDWMVPVSISAGIRYEKTEVRSIAQVFPPIGNIGWIDDDNFIMTPGTIPENVVGRGRYDYWLPHFDLRIDLRENLALRGSWGRSIGRPGWQDIQSGVSLATRYGRQGGSGNGGDPGLLPLESSNFDLSLEWYYAEGSYASIGWFRKRIKNFAGNTITTQSPFPQVLSPIGGGYWNDAINLGGCAENDLICIRNDIFTRHADSPGVDARRQIISGGQPGDPPAQFSILIPVNQRSDTLDGWEISIQHMFGRSGFGIAANYTKVDSGLRYDNSSLDAQYPMVGLSDSANLVLFYEQYGWQIRAAWNWRDEFLSSTGGAGTVAPNPYYTERYGQLDLNITRMLTGTLAVFVEAINLTDQTQRRWVRHPNMLGDALQTGTRYMFGMRYSF